MDLLVQECRNSTFEAFGVQNCATSDYIVLGVLNLFTIILASLLFNGKMTNLCPLLLLSIVTCLVQLMQDIALAPLALVDC